MHKAKVEPLLSTTSLLVAGILSFTSSVYVTMKANMVSLSRQESHFHLQYAICIEGKIKPKFRPAPICPRPKRVLLAGTNEATLWLAKQGKNIILLLLEKNVSSSDSCNSQKGN